MLRQNNPSSGAHKNICGARIKKLREGCGKTLVGLSAELEVDFGLVIDRSVLGKIESGRRKITDYELVVIAEALDVPVKQLFPVDSLEAFANLKRGDKDES